MINKYTDKSEAFDFIDTLRIQNIPSNQNPEHPTAVPGKKHLVSGIDPKHTDSETNSKNPRVSEDVQTEVKENDQYSKMPSEARRALVFLLRQGVILSSQKSMLFEAICQYEAEIRQHLSEVYLKLVLDEKSGVAFVASAINEHGQNSEEDDYGETEVETVSLITRRTLPLYDTLLLLVLRKHYQNREIYGEQKIVIDSERIESDLSPFLPLSNSTRSDRKKLNGALKKMVSHKILSTVRGSMDRFEITPVIRYVVSAEFLESMLAEYTRIAGEIKIEPNSPDRDSLSNNSLDIKKDPSDDNNGSQEK